MDTLKMVSFVTDDLLPTWIRISLLGKWAFDVRNAPSEFKAPQHLEGAGLRGGVLTLDAKWPTMEDVESQLRRLTMMTPDIKAHAVVHDDTHETMIVSYAIDSSIGIEPISDDEFQAIYGFTPQEYMVYTKVQES